MAKKPTSPIRVTAHLADGRINSADGIIMLDAILYHAWFYKHAPHVLEGLGSGTVPGDGHIGLPLRQLPGNRYAASRAVYAEEGQSIEHWNKRPNFFTAGAEQYLGMDKGIISSSIGLYRAYRMPQVIRHIKDGLLTFWAMGHADEVLELLETIPAVGKKPAMGWGVVDKWMVEDCDEDFCLFHPDHGLMRPTPVEDMEISGYPIMQYAVRPPYWKQVNQRLCYVPLAPSQVNDNDV